MLKNNVLIIGILSGGMVTSYPNPMTFLKLVVCVLIGITIWSAISRTIKKRTLKQKASDYFGQVILSLVFAYAIKKYIHLVDDLEFLLAGFVSGLLSYGILLVYRWLTSTSFTDFVKAKIKNKIK